MVDRHRYIRLCGYPEQLLCHGKQARQHFRIGEVGAQLFLTHRVARLLEFLGRPGDIPGLQTVDTQLTVGKRLQLGKFLYCGGLGALGQIPQEGFHFLGGLCHFARQRTFGVVLHPQQVGLLSAQGKDFRHHIGVIELTGIGAHIGSPGDKTVVHLVAQLAVFRMGHHRKETRAVQRQQPAGLAFGLRQSFRGGQCGVRNTLQLCFVADVQGPGVGRVQYVVGKLVFQFRQALADGRIAVTLCPLQAHPAQVHIAQPVAHRLFARLGPAGKVR